MELLNRIDVYQEIKQKLEEFRGIKSAEQKKKAFALIKLLINLYTSGVRPEKGTSGQGRLGQYIQLKMQYSGIQ